MKRKSVSLWIIFSAIKWIVIAKNVAVAETIPTFPILSAKSSNFSYNGVGSGSACIFKRAYPYWECIPTSHTNIVPVPSMTLVPLTKSGYGFSTSGVPRGFFSTLSVSPINLKNK